jgi:transcriptional regulator with XRE-family HTH domain
VDATNIVNALMRRIKEREGLTDGELADRLGIDRATLYRWRKGDIGKPATILIPLVLAEHQATELEQVAA